MYEFTKILLSSETYRRPIRDLSETHRKPTCLIVYPSETDMPHRRPIGDQLEEDMPERRRNCLIGEPLVTDMPHLRPTCIIRDRPWARYVFIMGLSEACLSSSWSPSWSPMGLWWDMSVSNQASRSPIRHVSLQSTCWSPMRRLGLRWVSIRHVGLWWVSDHACRSPTFSWTRTRGVSEML